MDNSCRSRTCKLLAQIRAKRRKFPRPALETTTTCVQCSWELFEARLLCIIFQITRDEKDLVTLNTHPVRLRKTASATLTTCTQALRNIKHSLTGKNAFDGYQSVRAIRFSKAFGGQWIVRYTHRKYSSAVLLNVSRTEFPHQN